MDPKGFLLVLMQPPPTLEEEFNAWYDTDHLAERLAVPGFETALRYVCQDGFPRYLAMYDLESFAVMESPEYLRVAFDNSSPWTKRVTARARVQRFAGHQLYPGDHVTGRAARIGIIRFRGLAQGQIGTVAAGMEAIFAGRREVIRHRVLVDPGTGQGADVIGFVEGRAPLPETFDPAAFGSAADNVDLVAGYTPF